MMAMLSAYPKSVLFLIILLSAGEDGKVITIPNGVYNIEYYLCTKEGQKDLVSGTTLKLLEETNHTISSGPPCLIQKRNNILITSSSGEHQIEIRCVSPGRALAFYNVNNLTISWTRFTNCGGILPFEAIKDVNDSFLWIPQDQHAVFLFSQCNSLLLLHAAIVDYSGYAILSIDCYESVILKFIHIADGFDYDHTGSGLYFYYTGAPVDVLLKIDYLVLNDNRNVDYNTDFLDKVVDADSPHVQLVGAAGLSIYINESSCEPSSNITVLLTDILGVNLNGTQAGALFFVFVGVVKSSIFLNNVMIENSNLIFNNNSGIYWPHRAAAITAYFISVKNESLTPQFHGDHYPLTINDLCVIDINSTAIFIGQTIKHDINYHVTFNSLNVSRIEHNPYRSYGIVYITDLHGGLAESRLSVSINNIYIEHCICTRTEMHPLLSCSQVGIIVFSNLLNASINNGVFKNNVGSSVLVCQQTRLFLKGNINFIDNVAEIDGAIQIKDDSMLIFEEPVTAQFVGNKALIGGGIAATRDYFSNECVIQFKTEQNFTINSNRSINITVTFSDNMAGLTGNFMYANPLYNCVLLPEFNVQVKHNVSELYKLIYHNGTDSDDVKDISTMATRICFCNSSKKHVQCENQVIVVRVYPGQQFSVPVAGFDSRSKSVQATVMTQFRSVVNSKNQSLNFRLPTEQVMVRVLDSKCTLLNYTILAPFKDRDSNWQDSSQTILDLAAYPVSPNAQIDVTIMRCPLGFEMKNSRCECKDFLAKIPSLVCDNNNMTLTRTKPIWVGFYKKLTGGTVLAWSEQCPPKLCFSNLSININLSRHDSLCMDNATGSLCGKCNDNFSLVFGADLCQECSNWWLFTIVLYISSGILLICIIMQLRLTITNGTINGIIFYANTVGLSMDFYFPENFKSFLPSILRVFISIVNLDFGYPICFYNGMTQLAKTAFQFFFPFYIWVTLITVIILSHYFAKFAKITGEHKVPVMITLLHLSFFRVLQTIVTIFAGIQLHLDKYDINGMNITDENNGVYVWYYDGTIEFDQQKFLALSCFSSLMLLLFIIPYAFTSTTCHWLIRYRFFINSSCLLPMSYVHLSETNVVIGLEFDYGFLL